MKEVLQENLRATLWFLYVIVADVEPVLQYLKCPVKSEDGIYCSFKPFSMLFSLSGKIAVKVPIAVTCNELLLCRVWSDERNPDNPARVPAPGMASLK